MSTTDARTIEERERDEALAALAAAEARAEEATRERDEARAYGEKWRRIRVPKHGTCCHCQACGLHYDECRCSLDEVVDERNALASRLAEAVSVMRGLADESDPEVLRHMAALLRLTGNTPQADLCTFLASVNEQEKK